MGKHFQDRATNLPVRALKRGLPLVMGALPVRIFILLLQHYAVIHKGIVPLTRIGSIKCLFYQRQNLSIFNITLIMKKAVDKYPPYVRLDKNRRLMKCKGSDCRSSRPTDTRKSC